MIEVFSSDIERVIIAPDVIALSMFDAHCREVLEAWRDGIIQPVVNRDLLRLYIRVLDRLGLSKETLRNWVLWFTADSTSLFLNESSGESCGATRVLQSLAERGGARMIISQAPRSEGRWVQPFAFVANVIRL